MKDALLGSFSITSLEIIAPTYAFHSEFNEPHSFENVKQARVYIYFLSEGIHAGGVHYGKWEEPYMGHFRKVCPFSVTNTSLGSQWVF